jgi:ABC-type lipoprotein export system ATPase subunit
MCPAAKSGIVDAVQKSPAARARSLTKVYGEGDSRVVALAGVDVDFHSGRFTAIMGPSGSGKSTLMHCVAGLDEPTSGEVYIGDAELSGGQQQRVACARALITNPDVVFADEPTGALDSTSSADLLELLRTSVDEFGRTVVMVTHEPAAAAYADRVLFLVDGRLVDELAAPTADGVLDRMKHLERAGV